MERKTVTSKFVLKGDNQLATAFNKARTQMNDLAKQAAVFGAAAAAGVGVVVRAQAQYIDQLAKTSDFVGVSVEALQSLRYAAGLTGVSVTGLDDSMRRLNRRAGEFANSGGGPAAKAFEQLKIEIRDAGGAVKSTEVLFDEIVVAMQGVETDAQRAALAAQLFGDDFGPKMVPLINQGIEGIAEARRTFEALHGVITETEAAGVERMNDALTTAQLVGQGLARNYTAALAPAVAAVAEWFAEASKESGGFKEQATSAAESTVRAFAFLADAVAGLQRVFQVWGRTLALFFASAQHGFLSLADTIINGPGRAVDWLIEQMNRIPMLDIEFRFGSPAPQIGEMKAQVAGIIEAAVEDIDSILMEALPGQEILRRWEAVRDQLTEISRTPPPAPPPAAGGGRVVPERYDDGGYLEGLKASLGEVDDKAKDTLGSMKTFAEQAARNMQDILAQFLFDPFKDGLDGMLRNLTDMLRKMAAEIASQQILGALFSAMSGSSTGWIASLGAAFGGGRAMGGPVSGGTPYLVGERGPELFVPGASGNIVPSHAMGGNVTVNIDARQTDDPARLLALAPVIANQVERSIALKMRRGYL